MSAAAPPLWQLEVALDAAASDAIEELAWQCGALSTSALPAADAPDLFEPDPGALPLWQAVQLQLLFAERAQAENAWLRIAATLHAEGQGLPAIRIAEIGDAQWLDAWRQHVRPRCFANRLWVTSSADRTPDMGSCVVELEAGLAFGTGAHATTALCLEAVAQLPLAGARVLDVGSGSGILGIAALRLGAVAVVAVDHDPQARLATTNNAEENGVAAKLRVAELACIEDERFELVLANILAGTLIDLAPTLRACVAPGGVLVLSGVLASQANGVCAAYPDVRFEPARLDSEAEATATDPWVCLVGRVS